MTEVLNVLARFYLFDLWVFSQWWLYAPMMIPFAFYFLFFLVKWAVLTLPVWAPVWVVVSSLTESGEK